MATTPSRPSYLGAFHMSNASFSNYEPQRLNNFELNIDGIADYEAFKLSVHSAAIPEISVDPIEIPYGNTRVKVAGAVTYNDVSVVVNDWIGKDIEKVITMWMNQVFNPDTQAVGQAATYKKSGTLSQFSADGTRVRHWRLIGLWPTSVSYGDYAQDSSDRRQISMTLSCDYAIRE